MSEVLSLSGVSVERGRMPVVRELSFGVDAGQVLALLGPNGAGKSTTLHAVAGRLPASAGEIRLFGRSVARRRPELRCRAGLAYLPEGRGIFGSLTVGENLRLRCPRSRAGRIDHVLGLFPGLAPLWRRRAGLLSGGEQQMLALSCALVNEPRLLLIDELSLGLAPSVVERLLPMVRQVAAEQGTAIVLVEQHAPAALRIADRACVLRHGEVVFCGAAADLRNDPGLLEAAYLGPSDGSVT